MITGLYPSEHGAWTIGVQLDESCRTLGDMLRPAGYHSALIGKAHFQPLADSPDAQSVEKLPEIRDLNLWRGFHGPFYGFDHVETARMHGDEFLVGQHYALWMEERGLMDWPTYFMPIPGEESAHQQRAEAEGAYWKPDGRTWLLPESQHYTTWTGERSAAYIEQADADQPFFLWASFHDPHPPYVTPEPWASMYDPDAIEPGHLVPGEHDANPAHFRKTQEPDPDFSAWHDPHLAHGCHSHLIDEQELRKDVATYYGMISFLDKEVGRILDALEKRDMLDNTLIVFTTDHGHFIGQHGLIAKGPFHYEDLLRVPFIACWPGRIPAGEINTSMQSLVDLTPTFLEAAGVDCPGNLQGESQLAVWQGERASVRDHILCENRHNPDAPHLTTYVGERFKITVYRDGSEGELFDLEKDPGELHNLWNDDDAASLRCEMLHAMTQGLLKRESLKMPRVALA